jgi:hypothetical protein
MCRSPTYSRTTMRSITRTDRRSRRPNRSRSARRFHRRSRHSQNRCALRSLRRVADFVRTRGPPALTAPPSVRFRLQIPRCHVRPSSVRFSVRKRPTHGRMGAAPHPLPSCSPIYAVPDSRRSSAGNSWSVRIGFTRGGRTFVCPSRSTWAPTGASSARAAGRLDLARRCPASNVSAAPYYRLTKDHLKMTI